MKDIILYQEIKRPRAGDGYGNGFLLYSSYFVPNKYDAFGLSSNKCGCIENNPDFNHLALRPDPAQCNAGSVGLTHIVDFPGQCFRRGSLNTPQDAAFCDNATCKIHEEWICSEVFGFAIVKDKGTCTTRKTKYMWKAVVLTNTGCPGDGQ